MTAPIASSKPNKTAVGSAIPTTSRRALIQSPTRGGRLITEGTDLRSRLSRIDNLSRSVPIAQYSYDLGDRVLQRDYRNGVAAAYSYNNNDWITNLQHGSTVPIMGF